VASSLADFFAPPCDRQCVVRFDVVGGDNPIQELEEFDDVLRRRRAAASQYKTLLGDLGSFQAGSERGTWQFVPLLLSDAGLRARCLAVPRTEVEFRAYYEPLHRISAYAGAQGSDTLRVTEHVAKHMLSLPMANDLRPAEISVVAAVVQRETELVS
jgi:dTDP-4-amino-4,6-dideoxygalactose transaminase